MPKSQVLELGIRYSYSQESPRQTKPKKGPNESSWISAIFLWILVLFLRKKSTIHIGFSFPECPCEKFMNWPFFGLVRRGHSWYRMSAEFLSLELQYTSLSFGCLIWLLELPFESKLLPAVSRFAVQFRTYLYETPQKTKTSMHKFAPPRPSSESSEQEQSKPTQIRTPSWKGPQRRTYWRRGVQIRIGLEPVELLRINFPKITVTVTVLKFGWITITVTVLAPAVAPSFPLTPNYRLESHLN